MKRKSALCLTLCVVLNLFVFTQISFAADVITETSGSFTYTYNPNNKEMYIDGEGVLDRHMFALDKYYNEIESLIIGDNITEIGMYLFWGCPNMVSLKLGKNLKTISIYCFSGSKKLKSVEFPESLTKIDDYSFASCESLKSVYIHSGITYIGMSVFTYGSSLESIIVDEQNPRYISKNGILYDKSGEWLMRYPSGKTQKRFIVPSHVTNISGGAFAGNKNLTSVIIPESVEEIIDFCFGDCDNLKILCYENSKTHEFAKNFEKPYELITFIPGDIDCSGSVTLSDAMKIFQYIAGKADISLTGDSFNAADMDADTQIKLNDAMMIFQTVAGK